MTLAGIAFLQIMHLKLANIQYVGTAGQPFCWSMFFLGHEIPLAAYAFM
jgi:hypothetical protein